jgi:hypothetical protein
LNRFRSSVCYSFAFKNARVTTDYIP